jgi:hypothetical protein
MSTVEYMYYLLTISMTVMLCALILDVSEVYFSGAATMSVIAPQDWPHMLP